MAEANRDTSADTPIVFRIELHRGDLIVDGDELYGNGILERWNSQFLLSHRISRFIGRFVSALPAASTSLKLSRTNGTPHQGQERSGTGSGFLVSRA